MSAKNKLEALRNSFAKKVSDESSSDQSWKLFYPFWKMPEGATAIVRFLPDLDEDNSLQFLVENLQHELVVNGQRKKIPCLSMHGEDCPICALSRKYYDEDNKDMGKKYYRKKSYVGQVIVIESPFEHDQNQLVKLVEFGPQVFKQIEAAFQSGDLEEVPYAFKGGYNFRFRKTKTGSGENSYTTSNFAPKQSDLDDELIESLKLFNLADYRGQKVDAAAMEAMIIADQTGSALATETKPKAQASAASAPAAQSEKEAGQSEPTAQPTGAGTMSVLEKLRARSKAQQGA
jgi:hypothetical protein